MVLSLRMPVVCSFRPVYGDVFWKTVSPEDVPDTFSRKLAGLCASSGTPELMGVILFSNCTLFTKKPSACDHTEGYYFIEWL